MKKIKILVVRFRRIGDSVLSLSVLNSLKRTIPNSEIHYVLDDYMVDLFENQSSVDKVISFSKYEKKSFSKYVKKVWGISRSEKYDIIIDLRSTFNTLLFSLFSLGAKYRIGLRKSYNLFIHNYRIRPSKEINYVYQQLALLQPLNKGYTVVQDPDFSLSVSEEQRSSMKQYMVKSGIDFSRPVLICTVASRVKDKQWNLSSMTDVLSLVLEKYKNIQMVFNYANNEEKVTAETIYKSLKCDERIFINIEATSLIQLCALLSNTSFLFGNEGGVRHIAQALQIPSFALFSPGNSIKNWLPNRSFEYDGIDCDESFHREVEHSQFDNISVQDVWVALEEKLDKFISKEI